MVCGTLSSVRWALIGTSGVSLVAHGAVAVFLFFPRGAPALPAEPVDPPPATAGETFELPAPETAAPPLANASPSPDSNAAPAPVEFPDAPARPTPPSRAKAGARPSHQGRPSAGKAAGETEGGPGSSGTVAMYGAVGDRSAQDISHAFIRSFPQAASGDPIWKTAPLGPAGDATLILTLDDAGKITDVQVQGSLTGPLAQGIQRTMALIKGRPFIAKGKVTRLHLSATINTDTVHDGLHGDVFAIGQDVGAGGAFFALNVGRRVDLRVRR